MLIMNYYKNARNIPSSNIVHLDSLVDEDIYDPESNTTHSIQLIQGEGNEKELIVDTDNFWCTPNSDVLTMHAWIYFNKNIAIPIANHLDTTIVNGEYLKNTIRFIVLCKGIPFRIEPRHTYSESCSQNVPVDALLCFLGETIEDPDALLDYFNDNCPLGEIPTESACVGKYTVSNPYRYADPTFSMDHHFIPNHYTGTANIGGQTRNISLSYLISHLDATSLDIVKNMIDSSIVAINSSNYDWFIDSDPSPCQGSSQILQPSATAIVFDDLGITDYFIENSDTVYPSHPNDKLVMNYSSNGRHTSENPDDDCDLYFDPDYIQTQLDFTYIAGSVFNTAESFNARSTRNY